MYWYLCSSYYKHPWGTGRAFQMATRATGQLMNAGIPVFSPVTHLHPLTSLAEFNPRSGTAESTLYDMLGRTLLDSAYGLIVLRDDEWENNSGIHWTIARAKDQGKPVVFMDPGTVPAELRQEVEESVG